MTINEHDAHRRARRYSEHVLQLCMAFDVRISPLPPQLMDRAAAGWMHDAPVMDDRTRLIRIAEPTDETTYAAALHELGHLLHPLGTLVAREGSLRYRTTGRPHDARDVRLRLTSELAAWEWAHANALEWTEVMTFVERTCMAEYRRRWAHRFGVTL